jgi:hypothetical protein
MAFIDARVAAGADSALSADLAVDLGAGHSLWLNQREPRFAPTGRTIATTLGHGLSGELHGQVGRVRRLEIGPFAFDDVVTIFPATARGGVDFRVGSRAPSPRFRLVRYATCAWCSSPARASASRSTTT